MSEIPASPPAHPKGASVLRRKVMGVPVLYLALVVVAVLVFFAWKSKSTSTATADAAATDGTFDANGNPTTGGLYDADGNLLGGETSSDLNPPVPVGTVVVAASTADATTDNSSITTNDEWLSKGVALLIKQGTGAGSAQLALQTYLEGAVLTFDQGVMRDKVITEYGLPPYPPFAGETLPQVKPPTIPTPAPVVVPIPVKVPVPAPKPKPVPLPKPKPKPVPKPGPRYPGSPLRVGSHGSNVILVQHKVGVTADGDFGPKTQAAVKVWQHNHGLTADGIVGPITWNKMF